MKSSYTSKLCIRIQYTPPVTWRYRQRGIWRAWKVLLVTIEIWKIHLWQCTKSKGTTKNRPYNWWVAVKSRMGHCALFSVVSNILTEYFNQRIAWETLLQSLQLRSFPWSHDVALPQIVTFTVMEKGRKHKEEIRKTKVTTPWCIHCSCFSWWKAHLGTKRRGSMKKSGPH